MTDESSCLEIAGIPLVFSYPPHCADRLPVSFADFVVPVPEDASPESVHVRVKAGFHAPESAAVLLASVGSWSMFRQGARRHLVWQARRGGTEPNWCVSFEVPVHQVTVTVRPPAGTGAGTAAPRAPLHYPLSHTLMVYALARHGGVIVHAAGLSTGADGLICCGRSGAGKSTLAHLWAEHGNGLVLSDDRIIVRPATVPRRGGAWRLFGTPWPSQLGAALNRNAELKALVFLRHAAENTLSPLSPREAAERLLPVASVPWHDADVLSPALAACETLAAQVPAYDFGFTPDARAVRALEELLPPSA
jgi:hypothetical protein